MTVSSPRDGWLHARAVVAVVAVAALYALVLQALLGTLSATPVSQPTGQMCLPSAMVSGEAGARGEAPAKHLSHDACCLACAGGLAIEPATAPLVAPARHMGAGGRRDAGGLDERALRPGTARARAPPVI